MRHLAAAILALTATSVFAQVTIAPPPKHECKQPEPLSLQPSQNQIKQYNKTMTAYKTCMQAYIQARQDAAAKIAELHQTEIEAGNVAIKEFNEWLAATKAREEQM